MSEHIKTGEEIIESYKDAFDSSGELKILYNRWVELSWLKEQIYNAQLNSHEYQYCKALAFVLSLLEEK